MKNPNKSPRHIPSRYIHYTFVCRNCGKSDDGTFDKFTNPKQRDDIFCEDCEKDPEIFYGLYDKDLPF